MSAAEFKEVGNKHLQAKEFDKAIEAYTQAIALDPSNHVFYSNRSAAYLSKGDAQNALNDGLKCTEVNPSFAKGYSRHGAALHALKKYDEAMAVYEKGLQVAPSDAGLLSGKAEVSKAKAAASMPPPPAGGGMGGLFTPQMMSKLAGNPKWAARMQDPQFKAKIAMAQTNPQMMLQDPEMMEVLQAMLGDMGGAAGGGKPFAGARPGAGDDDDSDAEDVNVNGAASFGASTSSSSSSAKPEAKKPAEEDWSGLDEAERTKRETKKRAEETKAAGNAAYKAKNFEEAIRLYEEAAAIDPSNILYLNNKAAVLVEQGKVDEALALCEKALEIGKTVRAPYEDKAKVYQRMGAAYLKKEDVAQAIKHYESAQMESHDKAVQVKIKNLELELKKKEKQAYINPALGAEAKERGNEAFRAGNFPVAIKEYEDAVKRDPTNAAYYNNLAAALVKVMDFNGAKAAVEKSLSYDQKYVKAWAKKGDIEFFMKEYHKSIDSFKAGLAIEPGNALCTQGLQKTMHAIQQQNMNKDADPERAAHAMADPEIQMILSDPVIRNVLNDFQEHPQVAQRAMADPIVRAKIEKLINAGVLKVA